ncbi:hypothetical protein [Methylorubrum salsuginis]|uniref:Uncharacterized protein n=1 Tax=Methylorubrum salsuginis TaxID=414703 RepID=A0A1I4K5I6_9HYPH|nr:hypothetical protein [Methylorubrum salsuginis]SFL73887.1 hypothetical protein SAMN04488125_1232 [Methylorubrum salsuginis]
MPVDTLSLYLDLEEGQKADLEVASRAAIAFAEAVREIAAFVDPFSDVKVELIGTTEGSISFDTKIRFRTASGTKEITLYALVIVCMIYLGSHIGDFLIEKGLGKVWEQVFVDETKKLTQAEIDEVARTVVQAIDARAGERQAKSIYSELEKDQSVKGVGLTTEPGVKPRIIVPSFEFLKRSGAERFPEPVEKKRKVKETKNVVLVSPVLQHDRKRRWKFRLGDHEFGAPIKDEYFLDAVFQESIPSF